MSPARILPRCNHDIFNARVKLIPMERVSRRGRVIAQQLIFISRKNFVQLNVTRARRCIYASAIGCCMQQLISVAARKQRDDGILSQARVTVFQPRKISTLRDSEIYIACRSLYFGKRAIALRRRKTRV